jgi:esterase/lipase superfamily enzyme
MSLRDCQISVTLRRTAQMLASLLLLGLLTGCQTPLRLMPTPVKFSSGEIDPFRHKLPDEQETAISVLYATNRGVLIEVPHPLHTIIPQDQLRFGKARVAVGDGSLSWERLHQLSTSDDPSRRPLVWMEKIEQMALVEPDPALALSAEARAFFALVDEAIAASPNQDLIIYVHGANSAVPRATAQAAQFRHFTGRRTVVLSFLWPSAGSLLSYFTDVRNAAASVPEFARLVELLARHTSAKKIHVLAYSAGAQVASPGLALLGKPRDGESREVQRARLRLGQVYFAAPDVEMRAAVGELGVYVDLAERVSLAANLNDSALAWAERFNRSGSRAGRPNPTELSAEQTAFLTEATRNLNFDLIKVDPNDIPGLPFRSHAFWYDNPWVSADVLAKFLLDASPQRRGLESQTALGGVRFWVFPPDYDARVLQLMRDTDMGPPVTSPL